MSRRITDEQGEEARRLYDTGLKPSEIAMQTGISYSSVYGLTKVRQRVNPETGEKFKSYGDYQDYLARQRVNPETEEKFKSYGDNQDYLARQRVNQNKEQSDLIRGRLEEMGKNQSWLAEQLGVSKQAVSLYIQGKSKPRGERLDKLLRVLNINNREKPKTIDDLVEES